MKSAHNQSKQIETPNRAAWRIKEFCASFGISASTFWKYQAAGMIKTIRIGGRVLVPAAEAARIASEGL
jgi:hypothetical protein